MQQTCEWCILVIVYDEEEAIKIGERPQEINGVYHQEGLLQIGEQEILQEERRASWQRKAKRRYTRGTLLNILPQVMMMILGLCRYQITEVNKLIKTINEKDELLVKKDDLLIVKLDNCHASSSSIEHDVDVDVYIINVAMIASLKGHIAKIENQTKTGKKWKTPIVHNIHSFHANVHIAMVPHSHVKNVYVFMLMLRMLLLMLGIYLIMLKFLIPFMSYHNFDDSYVVAKYVVPMHKNTKSCVWVSKVLVTYMIGSNSIWYSISNTITCVLFLICAKLVIIIYLP
ncbi:hypothetical protein ACJX0J_024994, partial [Zea mays]